MQKVSVLINNYNYANYLAYCIESVLNQSYKNVEIILYDDGSTDNSLQIANSYSDKVRVITCPNYGKHPSFNQLNAIYQAFRISNGEIICLLDSDDAFQTNKVEKIVDAFDANHDAVLVQHRSYEINKNNKLTGKTRGEVLPVVEYKKFIIDTGTLENLFVQTSALSFRRSYLEKVLPLKEEDNYKYLWADVKLSRRAIFFGSVITLDEYLGFYRVHSKNDSNKLKNKQYLTKVIIDLYRYFNSLSENNLGIRLHAPSSYFHKVIPRIRILVYLLKNNAPVGKKVEFLLKQFSAFSTGKKK